MFLGRPQFAKYIRETHTSKRLQSGLSSRAKHGGTVFSAVSGSIKDLATVPGSNNRLGP